MLPLVLNNPPQQLSSNDILAILFLGIFQIGIAYVLFTNGISKGVRSLDASIIGFIEPLLNPIWVFLIVGEQPSGWAILGGVVILGAVVFHTLRGQKNQPRNAE
jgi:drug/metabolite transporter (DMT)-like permease